MKTHAALATLTLATGLFTCPGERTSAPETLRFGIPQDPVSLDPAATTDLIYSQIAFNIYETLIRVDRETGRLILALATSWDVDRDGTIWKFHLRSTKGCRSVIGDNSPAIHGTIELHYFVETDTLQGHPKAQALKATLQKIGLQVELVRYRDWERYRQNGLIAGNGHLFWDGWMNYTRHPDGFLYPLFHSQSPHNYLQYENPRVDELLDEARRLPIGERQNELHHEIQKIILQAAPAVFIAHPNAVYATRKYVKGFKVDALAIPWLDKVRIE